MWVLEEALESNRRKENAVMVVRALSSEFLEPALYVKVEGRQDRQMVDNIP